MQGKEHSSAPVISLRQIKKLHQISLAPSRAGPLPGDALAKVGHDVAQRESQPVRGDHPPAANSLAQAAAPDGGTEFNWAPRRTRACAATCVSASDSRFQQISARNAALDDAALRADFS
jgi:hypothetical protein